ncbi:MULTISPECIES: FAD-dependent oxidoreductase [Pseudonocardia]|uniref:ferredoxin--NADP(+) reductase n=2 Tax=Pseudonocardia TaxID=1847 RepID=A0A1Y2MQ97_PSEAH|nr:MULTISPECIES: FAD-dependent oxidoreductase [Pseudonocardia]OSY37406.1 NADPH-ferredoxin reductase FprA [Pseudonocardia autotrophica]TDN77269.1 ferredoxin--NADP+ reductase [Pseudonocardia autotrophica]BBG01288.1 pyridine nucleotide-disulfide oxidoreductase [Pseudonocardia autotrophica]GEC26015.1 pyridine nucleotide-disulfide oxidoreductase [Pseudonocardia saturnea]
MNALRVAVVGAGPAGIYAADTLVKSDTEVAVDLFEKLPAPFGLVRYGVAPDHPRIKQIVNALHRVLDNPAVRLFGNVHYGTDLTLTDLREHYDAVIVATGCERDRDLEIPGIDLPGSHGAAEFVRWYDGHPDVGRDWTLDASSVAVIGAGNVALDVARVLAKSAEDMLSTEIPDSVHAGLAVNPATEVHVFARRGLAQAKFSPMELRELDHVPGLEVVVDPEGVEFDDGSMADIRATKHVQMVVKILQDWAIRDRRGDPRRVHLHFFARPDRVLGTDRVEGLRVERTEYTGDGSVRGTGVYTDYPVGAVYRAVGYTGSELDELPFDAARGVVPHEAGRVAGLSGVYAVGWIKRGPVGLIGHTKGCASETVGSLLADADDLPRAPQRDPEALGALLESRGVAVTTWDGWLALDKYERGLGEARGRERIKVIPRDEMTRISRTG